MSRPARLALTVVIGAAAAVVAFLVVRSLGSGGGESLAAPDYGDPIVVVNPVPIVGDSGEMAAMIVEARRTVRDGASDLGLTVEDAGILSEPSGGRSGSDDPAEPVDDLASGGPYPFAGDTDPPVSESERDRAVDACADDPPADCPEGTGGVVLAIRDLPALQGVLKPDPFAPGTAPYTFWPECPPIEEAVGRVSIGVSANRPVDITLDWWLSSPYRPRSESPSWTASMSTTDAQQAVWSSWAEDPAAGYDDPRYWIHHCFVIEGMEPGTYAINATLVDRSGSGDRIILPVQSFDVGDEHGDVPVQRRRPTVLLGWGLERLYVTATYPGGEDLVVRARPAGASCDTGGDPARVVQPEDGVIDGVVGADVVIPGSVRMAPDYPYLPHHSREVTNVLDLEPATDYVVCLYWVRGGGVAIGEVEAIPVSTPAAYRPVLRVVMLSDLIVNQVPVSISVPGCGWLDVSVPRLPRGPSDYRESSSWPLCAFESNLSGIDRRGGFDVTTRITFDGETYTRDSFVRTGRLACWAAPCLLRLNEIASVPLPAIRTERRLCGSGWGSGCDDEIPTRTAGFAQVEIVYEPGGGSVGWLIGEATPFRDTIPEEPRAVWSVQYPPAGGTIAGGVSPSIIVDADRPITLDLSVTKDDRWGTCPVEPEVTPTTGGVTTHHRFHVRGLCSGYEYELDFAGEDEDGNPVAVRATPTGPASSRWTLGVPDGAYATIESTVTVTVPADGSRYAVLLHTDVVRVEPMGVVGYLWTTDELVGPGWTPVVIDGRAGWCSEAADPPPLIVRRTGPAILSHAPARVSGLVSWGPIPEDDCGAPTLTRYDLDAIAPGIVGLEAGLELASDDRSVSIAFRLTRVSFWWG